MSTQLTTSSPPAPLYNILPINTRDETFNNIMTIQLGTFPLHLCCCAAPCHSYDYDMHFPWPYAHATPPPLPTTQPQPTWPLPRHNHRRTHTHNHNHFKHTFFAQSNRHCTNLRHSIHLDVCATISHATATHTPNSSVSVRSTFPFIPFATTTSYTTC